MMLTPTYCICRRRFLHWCVAYVFAVHETAGLKKRIQATVPAIYQLFRRSIFLDCAWKVMNDDPTSP